MGNDAFDVTSHLAATDMANDIRNNRIDGTRHDNEIFGKRGYGKTPNPVVARLPRRTMTGVPARQPGLLDARVHRLTRPGSAGSRVGGEGVQQLAHREQCRPGTGCIDRLQ
ncbi:hypothetical protein ACFQ3Z_46050 [Streptomyces nogalater]